MTRDDRLRRWAHILFAINIALLMLLAAVVVVGCQVPLR